MMQETISIVRCTAITTIRIVSILRAMMVVVQHLAGVLAIALIFIAIVLMLPGLPTSLESIVEDTMSYNCF